MCPIRGWDSYNSQIVNPLKKTFGFFCKGRMFREVEIKEVI